MNKPETVIAIPVWDTNEGFRFDQFQSHYTASIISQLQNTPTDNWLCVIVDNGSDSDLTRQVLATINDPRFHVIRNETNLGYSQAANQGVEYGLAQGAEYCVVMNNDMEIVDTDWLEYAFIRHLRVNQNWLMGARYIPDNGWTRFDGKCIPYLEGYLIACHSSLWRALGGMDSKFLAYMEDVDFSYRAVLAGYELHQSDAFIWVRQGEMENAIPMSVPIHHLGGRTGYNRLDFDYQSITRQSVLYFQEKFGFKNNPIPVNNN